MKRLALCIGLTRLDPASWDGWEGACPGCDRDARRFATKCHDAGFDGVAVLVDALATRRAVAEVYGAMVGRLGTDDLLALYYSGHGGQRRDRNGDEPDALDETYCFFDGEVTDDTIAEYLRWAPRDVRVVHVTDCCHAGTNFRSVPRTRKPVRGVHASLLHLGGCADHRVSYGEDKGGAFTIALLDALADARKPLSYSEWFERTVARMDETWQVPVMEMLGTRFAEREVLT